MPRRMENMSIRCDSVCSEPDAGRDTCAIDIATPDSSSPSVNARIASALPCMIAAARSVACLQADSISLRDGVAVVLAGHHI